MSEEEVDPLLDRDAASVDLHEVVVVAKLAAVGHHLQLDGGDVLHECHGDSRDVRRVTQAMLAVSTEKLDPGCVVPSREKTEGIPIGGIESTEIGHAGESGGIELASATQATDCAALRHNPLPGSAGAGLSGPGGGA